MTIATRATFTAPGPGTWFLDPTHFTRPVTRFHEEIFPKEFIRGFGDSLRRYGCLLEYLDSAFINGFYYYCPRPVGAPKDAVGHPPKDAWDDLARTHPEIRRRLETSATVFERKLWRDDLERWDRETKPELVRGHRELLAVDAATLDTTELLAYLARCRENQKRGCYLHHFYNVPALLPVGDFLVHTQEWTGRPAAPLLGLLQGSTPDPLGVVTEFERLTEAIRRDAAAQALLRSAAPADCLAALRARPGATGDAAAAYLDLVAYRPVNGEDVGDPNAIELPEMIVAGIRAAIDTAASGSDEGLAERTAAVRDRVPASQRNAFDQLLGEARLLNRLRDERGTFADLWAIGIMRRALLAAGEILAARGRINDPAHLVEAGHAEVDALVRSSEGPSAEELAERARYRLEASYGDAPPMLGPAPGAPLPVEWLPKAAARLERAMSAAVHALFVAPEARTEARRVRGLGVSAGVYEGTARVIRGPQEFGRLEQGDVLVTNSTTTAFNIVLPLLGAIVTDRGGLLSHAAIVAREFGIPAVVGCTHATATLPDGERVRVDGEAGEATVLN